MKHAIAAVATLALALGGCAGESSQGLSTNGVESGELGSVEANLTLPEGYSLNTVTYTVSGNGVSRTGNINVENSSVLRFRIGNLPIANDYTLTLSAQTTGVPPQNCGGSAGFDIENNLVGTLTMPLTCGGGVTIEQDTNGDITVDVNVTQGAGTVCPVVTGISALPLETAVNGVIQLEGYFSSAPTTSAWTGAGTFASASAAATAYTCTTAGLHVLTYTITKDACPAPSSYTVEVQCTGTTDAGTDAGSDAGETDAGSDAGETDAGSDAGTDASGETDAGSDAGSDAGTDAGPPPDPCNTCILAQCADYPVGSAINWVGPCFQNDPNNQFDPSGLPEVQPQFTQLCSDAANCSLAAPSNCADDAVGPARCYCGNQTISACLASGPVAGAECVGEWQRAAECPVGDYACTAGANFSDYSRPSGYAVTVIECANAQCATACGLTQ
jgi:hypothetical protein